MHGHVPWCSSTLYLSPLSLPHPHHNSPLPPFTCTSSPLTHPHPSHHHSPPSPLTHPHPHSPSPSLTLTPHSPSFLTLTPPGIAQAHASEAMEKERECAEKEIALQSRIATLEAQVKGLRQEKTKQDALLEAERAKLAAVEEGSQKLVHGSRRWPSSTRSRSSVITRGVPLTCVSVPAELR